MTFGDPVDITMFAQRRAVRSLLPCMDSKKLRSKWFKGVQLMARVWVGFVFDCVTIIVLTSLCNGSLPKWTLGWRALLGLCVSADVLLLLFITLPIVARQKICPRALKALIEAIEKYFNFDMFVLEYASFKVLSFLQASFVLGQCLAMKPDSLTDGRKTIRVLIMVIAIIDVVLDAAEMFASGCFWCVCCIHGTDVSPAVEQRARHGNKYETTPSRSVAWSPAPEEREVVFATELSASAPITRIEHTVATGNRYETAPQVPAVICSQTREEPDSSFSGEPSACAPTAPLNLLTGLRADDSPLSS